MRLALIGRGAIAGYVAREMQARGASVAAWLMRQAGPAAEGVPVVGTAAQLPREVDQVVDCAGHAALAQHGAAVLRAGLGLTTVSLGALARRELAEELETAAREGGSALQLVSGAIGGLDALRAARAGQLRRVRYVGRKPPAGWRGSPAETALDLDRLTAATPHFTGTARQAALEYPKNANVAAAVALAGLGFDDTEAELIADPGIAENIHEVHAEGDFGSFAFRIAGRALPGNPRSSALAAMSVVAALEELRAPLRFG
jgi:aspartate dehydrogenase